MSVSLLYAYRRPSVIFKRYKKLFIVVPADSRDLKLRLEAVSWILRTILDQVAGTSVIGTIGCGDS